MRTKISAHFLFELKEKGSEFDAGIGYAVEHGWLELHERDQGAVA
ncbi:hypothetical protein [Bradyrhizobium arachidis]|nr:hypothetical protein [Bradyrhizobium arachidis]